MNKKEKKECRNCGTEEGICENGLCDKCWTVEIIKNPPHEWDFLKEFRHATRHIYPDTKEEIRSLLLRVASYSRSQGAKERLIKDLEVGSPDWKSMIEEYKKEGVKEMKERVREWAEKQIRIINQTGENEYLKGYHASLSDLLDFLDERNKS